MVEMAMSFAQALYEIAQESNKEDTFLNEFCDLSLIWSENEELVQMMSHPKISRAEKREFLHTLFEGQIDSVLLRFLDVLVQHDMAGHLCDIYDAFVSCYQGAHHIEVVKVQSAIQLDEMQIDSLKEMLEKKLNKKVELDIKVDPSLIAGLRVQTKDYLFDNSIISKLKNMKETLQGSN